MPSVNFLKAKIMYSCGLHCKNYRTMLGASVRTQFSIINCEKLIDICSLNKHLWKAC